MTKRMRSETHEAEKAVGAADLDHRFRAAARARLRAERTAILQRVATTEEELRQLAEERESELEDRAQSEGTTSLLRRLDDRDQRELEEIDATLARLEEGAYGVCLDCGSRIPFGRLQAIPTARLCAGCAQTREDSGRPAAAVEPGPR